MNQLIFAVALLAPTMVFAQSPFDGTWKVIPDQTKFSTNPVTFSVSGGIYDNPSSVPKIHIKADGQDQPVSGKAYDTMAVKEIDAHTVQVVTKKNGKIVAEQTRTVTDDGKSMTYKTTSHTPDDGPTSKTEMTLERIGEGPAGANATSGSWVVQKLTASGDDLLTTYKSSGDGLSWSAPNGESWTAKWDGKDYPVKGDYSSDSVSLKQISDRTIEETYKRGGKLVLVSTKTVSADGKKMSIVRDLRPDGRTVNAVAEKQ